MTPGMEPEQSRIGHEHFSTHATISSGGKVGNPLITKSDLKAMSSYRDSLDSAIDIYEDEVPSSQSANPVSNHETDCLQDDLFSALISTHQENRVFFASDRLPQILTEERVRKELGKYFEDSLTEEAIAAHARTICHGIFDENGHQNHNKMSKTRSFIKVFAILIMIEKTQSIIKLLEENVNDSDLPLIKVPRPHEEKLSDLRLKRDPDHILRCFQKRWNQLNIRNFEELQWAALPVEFVRPTDDDEVRHYRLEEQRVLPFIKNSRGHAPHSSRRPELEGGFASVFKVDIHPRHHNFRTTQGRKRRGFFAVKRLHSQSEDAFDREVEMLKKFSNTHEHLISLLATYEQSDSYFLLFDWAEADLQRYWSKINPSPSFDYATVVWMATQCKGIASGIIKIHQYQSMYVKSDASRVANDDVVFGHHGDIKPENVLWFAEPGQDNNSARGTLKLSDFGLAELSLHQTISMAPKSKWAVSLAYRAPEADLKQGAAIGRSYDIWTLGCLYLEFITWTLGGSKLLNAFSEARKAPDAMWHDIDTYTFFKLEIDSKTRDKVAIIKPAVEQVSFLLSSRNLTQSTDSSLVHSQTSLSSKLFSIHPRILGHGGESPAGRKDKRSSAH